MQAHQTAQEIRGPSDIDTLYGSLARVAAALVNATLERS